jgi:hypothetical protein
MKRLLVLLLVVAAIGGTFYWLVTMRNSVGMRVNMERTAVEMAPEVKECRKRLGMFHTAWSRYRQAHRGSDPTSVAELFPRYLKSTDLLFCPTAKRLAERGRTVEQGKVRVAGREVPMSYEFHWAYDARQAADGKAILVLCPVHHELFARYIYMKDPAKYLLPPDVEKLIESRGSTGRYLAVRRDGTITQTDTR